MSAASPERTPSTEQISGLIERVTFHSDESGFCVLRVKVKGQPDDVTVVGSLPSVTAGEWLTAEGWWVRDKEHGLQFKAATLKTVPPTTAEGIQRYLGSGLVKGIGPILLLNNSTVKSLILAVPDHFGDRGHQRLFSFQPDQRNPSPNLIFDAESSQRTRSFLFLTVAALCARRVGHQNIVVIAENGQMAVHLPVTEGRIGPFSTRTAQLKYSN